MNAVLKIIFHSFIFVFLTIITQIGGIIYIISLFITKRKKFVTQFNLLLIFVPLYLTASLIITPLIAPLFRRERVKHSEQIEPANYFTLLLNRNYVRPELNHLLHKTSKKLVGIKIHYLDANFPFFDKFPLLPHLSHNDGKKIDLSFIYETNTGIISNKQKSISGYGVFEKPNSLEYNQIKKRLSNGYSQYNWTKYFTLGRIHKKLKFSKTGTKLLIQAILSNNSLEKLFIEPHLKQRLHLKNNKIRYHGCKAVRHDDHIHIQIK